MSAKRVAIYHRVSTAEQDVKGVRDELRMAASARNLNIAFEVEETGSGARNDRPGLLRILEAARSGKIAVVIVHKLDRFGRSAFDLLANIKLLESCGVRFIAVSQGLDIRPDGDPMSKLILSVLAGVAEFERSLIVERTKIGMQNARKAGKRIGRPPRAIGVQQILELRSQGASYSAIAKRLSISVGTAHRLATTDRSKRGIRTAARMSFSEDDCTN